MALIWWFIGITALLIGALRFANRDPERTTIASEGYLSPADGIIAAIHEIDDDKHRLPKGSFGIDALVGDVKKARHVIVIMMKPWHVHTQRAPVTGTIRSLQHRPGTLRNAVFGDWRRSTVENEHVSMRISGSRSCKVFLIAGLMARRIVPLVDEGQHLVQGERIGKIMLGSQVALVLPDSEVLVSVGDRVTAGVTEVAR